MMNEFETPAQVTVRGTFGGSASLQGNAIRVNQTLNRNHLFRVPSAPFDTET